MSSVPPPSALSGSRVASWAYFTLKDRVPVIICKLIDIIHRSHNERSAQGREDIKVVVENMARLRYELETNKPLQPIRDGQPDMVIWNNYLEMMTQIQGEAPTWFSTTWLYAECYAYRRLRESLGETVTMKDEDFFQVQKKMSFQGSRPAIQGVVKQLEEIRSNSEFDLKKTFLVLLKISLWGNKCDLSISSGDITSFQGEPAKRVETLEDRIIIDQSVQVFEYLEKSNKGLIDIVLDNVGFELVSDLVLADFLILSGLAKKVRLRAKCHPWFVSDTTRQDFEWTLQQLEDSSQSSESELEEVSLNFSETVKRWREYLQEEKWVFSEDPFWTYPHDFSQLKTCDPDLYSTLSECDLVIFKGDLNYRKLVGDLDWKPTTTFEEALQGFNPAPLVALRTLKADVVTGLFEGQFEALTKQDDKWMTSGNWAFIQFCNKRLN